MISTEEKLKLWINAKIQIFEKRLKGILEGGETAPMLKEVCAHIEGQIFAYKNIEHYIDNLWDDVA